MTPLRKVGFIFCVSKVKTFAKFKIFKELVKCEIWKKIEVLGNFFAEGNSHLQHSMTIVKLMGSKDN
jgi:hypothetical protein